MSLKKVAARIFLWTALATLLIYSIRGPGSGADSGLSVLMEPDGTGVWRDLGAQFNREYPGATVGVIEDPAAKDAREDVDSTAFLSGDSGYDIVYCDSMWVDKFAVAGWRTERAA